MGYKLQRIASLAACFESINEELIKNLKLSIIKVGWIL